MVTFRGQYFDGQSARRHEVRVSFQPDALRILSDDGGIDLPWPFAELVTSERPRPGQPARLSLKLNPDARLVIPDIAFVEMLRDRVPHLYARGLARADNRKWTLAIMATLLALGLFAWKGIPALADTIAPLVPREWEEKLGQGMRQVVLSEERHCKTAAGQTALENMVVRLTGGGGPESLKVAVVDFDIPNAFALPGGQVIIMRGLLTGAEGPDEVAGVLAHEIGHIVHRHPLRGFLRAAGFELLLSFVIGDVPLLIELAVEGGGLLLALSYSRDMERQADDFAVEMLTRTKIGSAGLQAFFKRIAELQTKAGTEDSGGTSYFSTHPDTAGRIAVIARAPAKGASPSLDKAQWQALKGICADLAREKEKKSSK